MPSFYNEYIIYGSQFGFVDLESVEKLISNRFCDKVVIFITKEPHENIKKALEKYPSIEIKLAKKPKKEAKKYKEQFDIHNPNKTSVFYSLEIIADRSMWLDVC